MSLHGNDYQVVFIVNKKTNAFTSFMNRKNTEYKLSGEWEVFKSDEEINSDLLKGLGYTEIRLGIALASGVDTMNFKQSAAEILEPRQPTLTVDLALKLRELIKTLSQDIKPFFLYPAYPSGQLGMENSKAPKAWIEMYSSLTGVQKATVSGVVTHLNHISSKRSGGEPTLGKLRGITMSEMIFNPWGLPGGLGKRGAAFLELVFDY